MGRKRKNITPIHWLISQVCAVAVPKPEDRNSMQICHLGGRVSALEHYLLTPGSPTAGSRHWEAKPGVEQRYSDRRQGVLMAKRSACPPPAL